MKQETLEEETLSRIKFVLLANNNAQAIRILEQYAEFQKERMYSEEDMQDFAKFCLLCKNEELPYIFPKDWLKHIKNKI